MGIPILKISENFDRWIEQKKTTIGSGDIGVIVGASPFMTPLKLWAVKTGRETADADNDYMRWGRLVEKPIAEFAAHKMDLEIEYGDLLFQHESISWATATPDFFVRRQAAEVVNKILECKNVGSRSREYWEDDTPLPPQFQVMWQMGVVGEIQEGIIAPMLGGDPSAFVPRPVVYDQRIFDEILELAQRFYWHVENDVPPEPRAEDKKLLEKVFGSFTDATVELDLAEALHLANYLAFKERLSDLNAQVKAVKKEMDQVEVRIRFLMKNAMRAKCGHIEIKATPVTVEPRWAEGYSYVRFSAKEGKQ